MPIVASTLRMRSDGRRNPRSRSVGTSSRSDRSSKDKPFVPPGKFRPSTAHHEEDLRATAPPRPNMAEHPIKRQKDTLKPFVPGGAMKYQPIAHEHYNAANEAARVIPRSTKRTSHDERRSASPAFIPAGSVREQFSASPPRALGLSTESIEAFRQSGSSQPPAGTEYKAQFREWDLPHKHVSSPGRHLSPLSTYHINLSTADWQSENRHAFRAHPEGITQGMNERIAGRPSRAAEPVAQSAPSSEARRRPESASPSRARVMPAAPASPHRPTETGAKFQWPAPSQRIINTQPPNQRWNPVPRDPALSDEAKWKSEYDEQCQLLRRQQQSLQADAAAGISTASNETKPTYFAWNPPLDSSTASLPAPPPPAPIEQAYNRGASEYKTKFQPWPLEETRTDLHATAPLLSTSRVLRDDDVEDAYAHLRQTSEYRDNFTKKAGELSAPVLPVQKAAPPPMVFAWQADAQQTTERSSTMATTGYVQDAASEYKRKFQWPLREEDYIHFTHSLRRPDAGPKALNLFDDTQPLAEGTRGVTSVTEHRSQYVEKDVTSASPPRHRAPVNEVPPQFAWPTNASPEDRPRRALRTTLCKEDSEMHTKFQWPPAGAAAVSTRKAEELKQADEGEKVGKVFALDADSSAAGWRTEYEEKFQALRSKTKETLDQIAGTPSAKKPVVPPFYAWPSDCSLPPPPPSSAGFKARHVSPDHFRTEYDDKFLTWQAALSTQARSSAAASSLNLFAPSDGAATAAGETSTASTLASEYKDKFKAVASREEEPRIGGHREGLPEVPPQFAWPLLEEELPKPPPVPRRAPAPLEKSEYTAKFAWPAPQPPTVSAGKALTEDHVAEALHYPPPSSTAVSTESAGSLGVDWTTEYDARHNARAFQAAKSLLPPAGLVVVKTEEVPAFFAWADQEEQKAVAPPQPPARNPAGEALTTEYSDQFRTKRAVSATSIASSEVKKHGGQGVDHISSLHILDSDTRATPQTEYDANFQSFSIVNQSTADFVKREQERQAQRPPQFAWSLVEPPTSSPPPPPPRPQAPFEGISEYDRCFQPIASTSSLKETGIDKETLSGHRSNPLGLTEEDKARSVTQWQSEYDRQCQSATRSALSTAAPATSQSVSLPLPPPPPPPHVAGVANPIGASAPSFFAWPVPERVTPPAPLSKDLHRPTGSSEYARQYSTAASSTLQAAASKPAPRRSSFESFEFGGQRLLNGVSEYDAQFTTAHSVQPASESQGREAASHPTAASASADRYRGQQSLATTNLDPNYADSIVEQMNKSASERSQACSTAPAEVSEAAEQYAWPRTPRAVAQPTLTPHRTKVMIGGHIPRSAYGDLPNKENIARLINRVEEAEPTPMTESQSQFRWPGAPADPAAVVVSAKEKSSPQKKKNAHLMQTKRGTGKYIDRPHVIPDRSYLYRASSSRHLRTEDGSPRRFVYDYRGNMALKREPPRRSVSPSSRSPSPAPAPAPRRRQAGEREVADDHAAQETINPNTMMSRDSLAESFRTSSGGTTSGTVVSTKSKGSSVSSIPEVLPGSPSDRLGRLNAFPAGLQTNERMIPGLRATEEPRGRSAPPRRLMSTTPVPKVYVDETRSNPLLINRRYPAVSDRQSTRWATETMDSFKWRPRTSVARRSLSP